jgi:hypothetical protein
LEYTKQRVQFPTIKIVGFLAQFFMKDYIGYLVFPSSGNGFVVWCKYCAERDSNVDVFNYPMITLYWSNIYPQSQDCHICGCLMVKPQNYWGEDKYQSQGVLTSNKV